MVPAGSTRTAEGSRPPRPGTAGCGWIPRPRHRVEGGSAGTAASDRAGCGGGDEERRAKRQRGIRTARRFAILGSPILVVIIVLAITNSSSSSSSSVTCQPVTRPAAKTTHLTAPPLGISPQVTYTAAIQTTCGTIDLGLDAQQYPTVVNNFVALANQGFYDNLAFVRSSKTDGIVQAGSPDQTNQTVNTGPGYTVQAETPTTACPAGPPTRSAPSPSARAARSPPAAPTRSSSSRPAARHSASRPTTPSSAG